MAEPTDLKAKEYPYYILIDTSLVKIVGK